jgi:hypothetical protein
MTVVGNAGDSASLEFLSHARRSSGDLIAKGTKGGGTRDMSFVRSLQLRRQPVRAIESVLKIGAAHQADALALVLKGGPVGLKLTIWKEILELNETQRPSRALRILLRRSHRGA